MGLDDYAKDDVDSSYSKSRSGGSRGGPVEEGEVRTRKGDFSRGYIEIVEFPDGHVEADEGNLRILKPGDNPQKDYTTICKFASKKHWDSFCDKAKDELGLDAEKIKEKNPARIPELKAHLANPNKPKPSRTCQVCGDKMYPDEDKYCELDLRVNGRTSVHEHHTIAEMSDAGLLD